MNVEAITNGASFTGTLHHLAAIDVSHLRSLASSQQMNDAEKVEKLAQEFEAMFMTIVMKAMRETVQSSDLFGKGLGADLYQSLFDQQLASEASLRMDLGFSDAFARKFDAEQPRADL